MNSEASVVLSLIASGFGALGVLIAVCAAIVLLTRVKLGHKVKAKVETEIEEAIDRKVKAATVSVDKCKYNKSSDIKLLEILTELNNGRIKDSEALYQAVPLLKDRISESRYKWLRHELNGYQIDQPGLLELLPDDFPSYRLVYADDLKMEVNGVITSDLVWPPAANRLMFVPISLSEIEKKIANTSVEMFSGPTGLNAKGIPPGIEAVALFHKGQLRRVRARFRQEFTKLLCSELGL